MSALSVLFNIYIALFCTLTAKIIKAIKSLVNNLPVVVTLSGNGLLHDCESIKLV